MKKLLQLGLILVSSIALTMTLANAKCNSGDNTPKTMKCESGKCSTGKCGNAGMKGTIKKETNTTKPSAEKKVPAKGKCGVGKCG